MRRQPQVKLPPPPPLRGTGCRATGSCSHPQPRRRRKARPEAGRCSRVLRGPGPMRVHAVAVSDRPPLAPPPIAKDCLALLLLRSPPFQGSAQRFRRSASGAGQDPSAQAPGGCQDGLARGSWAVGLAPGPRASRGRAKQTCRKPPMKPMRQMKRIGNIGIIGGSRAGCRRAQGLALARRAASRARLLCPPAAFASTFLEFLQFLFRLAALPRRLNSPSGCRRRRRRRRKADVEERVGADAEGRRLPADMRDRSASPAGNTLQLDNLGFLECL